MSSPGEETREFYRQQGYLQGFKDGYDAFEGGLPKAIATAELLERQRIIKIVEKLDGWDWVEIRTEDLIALIKGEQK